ncbi:MAG: hypothetical protein WB817_12140, partial [Terriglobales bacterium]
KLSLADSAFRLSAQDIEKHYQAQGMSSTRRAERTSQLAEELLPDPKELPRESSVTECSTSGASGSKDRSASTGHRPAPAASVTHGASPAAPRWSTAEPSKPWLPQPVAPVDEDTPWWLADVHASLPPSPAKAEKPHETSTPAKEKPELQRPAKTLPRWENASAWSDDFTPLKIGNTAPVALVETAPVAIAEIEPFAFAASAPAFEQETPAVASAKPVAILIEPAAPADALALPPALIAQTAPSPVAEAAPVAYEEAAPVAAATPAPGVAPHRGWEANPAETTSRLSPLRGLLFSLGMKNLSKSRESASLDRQSASPAESDSERTIIARTFSQFAEPVPVAAPAPMAVAADLPVAAVEPVPVVVAESAPIPGPSVEAQSTSALPKEVTTLPEFLPPREFVPVREPEEAWKSFDDMQTLPSRRGQYKRRS